MSFICFGDLTVYFFNSGYLRDIPKSKQISLRYIVHGHISGSCIFLGYLCDLGLPGTRSKLFYMDLWAMICPSIHPLPRNLKEDYSD
jgi:hypothetical protein